MYKDFWHPTIGETLMAKPEFGNAHDPYAVAVATVDDTTYHGTYRPLVIYFCKEMGISSFK